MYYYRKWIVGILLSMVVAGVTGILNWKHSRDRRAAEAAFRRESELFKFAEDDLRSGNAARAFETAQEILRSRPSDPDALGICARAKQKLNQPEEAAEYAARVLDLAFPSYAESASMRELKVSEEISLILDRAERRFERRDYQGTREDLNLVFRNVDGTSSQRWRADALKAKLDQATVPAKAEAPGIK